jgi:Putative prokaryotic signal transducing protein
MTQQHKHDRSRDAVVVIHRAANAAEASILRGVLQSAGIKSPSDTYTDPFPMQEPPAGFTGTEILVLSSQESDARKIVDDYYREDKKNELK